MNFREKNNIKERVREILIKIPEVKKVIIFGSFLESENPVDLDIAIFTNSKKDYLTQSLLFRRLLRDISKEIPMDVLPLKSDNTTDLFIKEVNKGEVIFESSHQ